MFVDFDKKRAAGDEAEAVAPERKVPRQKKTEIKITAIKDKAARQHATLMTKAVLASCQMIRELVGVVFDGFLLPVDSPEAVAIRAAGRLYAETVKKEGKKTHRRGPPAPYLLNGLLVSLVERGVALGAVTFRHLKAFADLYKAMGQDDILQWLRTCMWRKSFRNTHIKVFIGLVEAPGLPTYILNPGPSEGLETPSATPASSLRTVLRNSMAQIEGCRVLVGAAPPGALERLLQTSLEAVDEDDE